MISHSSAIADGQRGYGELGDLLGELVHRPSLRQVCAFCRTAGCASGRCEVCGARPDPTSASLRASPAPARVQRSPLPAAPNAAAVRMLGMVVVLPLLLFIVFGIWYAQHRNDTREPLERQQQVAAPATSAASPVDSAPTAQAPSALPTDDGAITAPEPPVLRAAKPTRARERVEPKSAAALGRCSEKNFFMRAVCINDTCARPGYRALAQCSQAIAQRRIDEQRHNAPMLN